MINTFDSDLLQYIFHVFSTPYMFHVGGRGGRRGKGVGTCCLGCCCMGSNPVSGTHEKWTLG